jgi:membrane protein DedA with SNARE-associated domain
LGVTRNRFLIAFGSARALRYSIVAWLGVRYGRQMIRWWNHYLADYSGAISWSILALFIAAFGWAFWKWHQSRGRHTPQPAHS